MPQEETLKAVTSMASDPQARLCFAVLKNQLASYLPLHHIEDIERAYHLAANAHQDQFRRSGEPYISHPIEVASILGKMHMDHQSIMAALLHDVLEDTSIDKATIAEQFGIDVAELVDGVSKLALIKFESRAEAQAENFRKMIMAMSKDLRVILIKLADRLHNMQTLSSLPAEKQRRIALETLEIYAPIANRLGMNTFRIEFEDLGFAYLYPIRHRVLKDAVKKARKHRKEIVKAIEGALKERLIQEKVSSFSINGREKHLYSLYKKMRKKDLSLSEIMDVFALRICVESVDSCYRILGITHNLYKPIHGRFKDYIAVPKANGYQSLHSTVVGPFGIPVEVQIRTIAMDRMAENGIAAHWLYKSSALANEAELRAREWLKSMLEIQENTGNSLEFIEHVKIDLYPDEAYVFTPNGDILSLPNGATAVDFAYAVHTDVGDACIAAKIDQRLVPLSTRLSSGHTVEIITAEGAHPNPAWLSFVVTGKARSNIRHWLKTQQESESRLLGQRLLERALSSFSVSLNDIAEAQQQKVIEEFKLESIERLFEEIGLGNYVAPLMAKRLTAELISEEENLFPGMPLAIKGTEGMVISYAKCCHPIPGDAIVGFLSAGKGIVIHTEHCKNVTGIQKTPEKYIFVQWDREVTGEFHVEIKIEVLNKRGMIAIIANTLTECETNIENINVDERDSRHYVLLFLIQVRNRLHLAKILKKLHHIDIVTRVSRVKP